MQLLTYTKVFTEEEAERLAQMFTTANIPYEIQHDRDVLDWVYIGDNHDPMYNIKIPAHDFSAANQLLKDDAKTSIGTLPENYYLLSFTNEELANVLTHTDEWNAFDQGIAEELLQQRGVTLSNNLKTAEAAYQPIRLATHFIVLEYLVSILLAYAGIIIGLATLFVWRTTPNGKKEKIYDATTQQHAKVLFVIGVITTSLWLSLPWIIRHF